MDKIIRATTTNGEIRAFVVRSRDLVEEARSIHQTSPVVSAALGRLLTGGIMMGATLKGDKDLITISIKGDGPMGNLLVTANSHGTVKGYVGNAIVDIPLKPNGKLDVSGAVGKGMMTVIRDLGLKEPYVGQTPIVSGEIAEDLTYYYANSEQTPSVIALGVLVDVDYTIKQSGGFMIQLMPGATDATITQLEKNIENIPSVTSMYEDGMSMEDILDRVLEGFGYLLHGDDDISYQCDCDRHRVERALYSIGKKELDDMIRDGESIDMHCHFCNTHYEFSIDELKEIRQQIKS